MNEKQALIDHPIHKFLAERWSPYAFEDRSVSQSDLCSLFEAARWSASSYNEQPWSYIVATKEDPDQFQQLLSCLLEGNQFWAKDAPVLVLGISSHKFARNGEDNRWRSLPEVIGDSRPRTCQWQSSCRSHSAGIVRTPDDWDSA
jgi:nitroreductase